MSEHILQLLYLPTLAATFSERQSGVHCEWHGKSHNVVSALPHRPLGQDRLARQHGCPPARGRRRRSQPSHHRPWVCRPLVAEGCARRHGSALQDSHRERCSLGSSLESDSSVLSSEYIAIIRCLESRQKFNFIQVVLADLDRSDGENEVDVGELSQKLADLADLCQEYKLQPAPDDDDAAEGETDRDYSYYEEDIVSEYAKLPLISKCYDKVR